MSIPSLADLIRDGERREPPLQPITPLPANYNGELVTVTAILERTAVFYYGTDDSERSMARLERLDVNFGLFADRARWKVVDGSRRSENGAADVRDTSRARGRHLAHIHRESLIHKEARERRVRLDAAGLEWCTRGRHEIPPAERRANGWCGECWKTYLKNRKHAVNKEQALPTVHALRSPHAAA